MSNTSKRGSGRGPSAVPFVRATLLTVGLAGCGAMGELARTPSWAWIAGVVLVIAVVGFVASRMRR